MGSAGSLLTTLFIHPTLSQPSGVAANDPDQKFIGEKAARSAILFGPPGTGKTEMAEAVAGALNWPFVEITPALFLQAGVEQVSARADEVFRQIMELDRCVVLFDEIDELIRHRGPGADPLERFFTTSMLPRLSKLWKQRKVLFFVNTNVITEVDSAIRRSSRFDAAIFVMPPSFDSKVATLRKAKIELADVTRAKIESLLEGQEEGIAPNQRDAAWFALLTYKQMERLVAMLRPTGEESVTVSLENLATALKGFGSELMSTDWRDYELTGPNSLDHVLAKFRALRSEQRLDHYGRDRVAQTMLTGETPEGVEVLREPNPDEKLWGYWKIETSEENLQTWAKAQQLKLDGSGRITA
ncbi:MAG TPA: ATP-binding protein [Chloroflexota bacterium]|nr:ATP-binding protein [Chloroflexota bacterium]